MKITLLEVRALALATAHAVARDFSCRVVALDEDRSIERFMVCDGDVTLAEPGEGKETWVTITRAGRFYDERYGDFEITRDMLDNMVRNFSANTYGQKIFIDVAHRPAEGAAGEVIRLQRDGAKLRALVRWNPLGVEAVNQKGYRYFSIEYADNYKDNEARKEHGATMFGAALCTRPVIKGLDALDRIELSEAPGGMPVLLHPHLESRLRLELQETNMKKEQMLKQLREKLLARGYSADNVEKIIATATKQLEAMTDEAQIKALSEAYDQMVETATRNGGANPGTVIQLTAPSISGGLDEAAVIALMEKKAAERAAADRQLAESLTAVRVKLAEAVNKATGVPEDQRKKALADLDGVLSAGMTDAQIKALADHTITALQAAHVATQLAARGFSPSGNVVFVSDEAPKKLADIYRDKLKLSDAYRNGQIKCPDKLSPFVEKVLSIFDQQNAPRVFNESKLLAESNGVHMLAGGQVVISDTSLPVGFQRQVILEALSDLRILDLVATDVDASATVTTQIPYETRDTASVFNDGIVYEGGPIHRAGVTQAMDIAYINAMKLAMLISNEVAHFSRTSGINWDATGRNVASNARLMRELIARRIANELQRSSDMFNSALITAEAFDAQVTGANSVIKTVQFPIVRPYQAKDLQGTNVGTAEAPITMTLNGVVISEYDGTGAQGAGTYYRITNYNLGYIQLVNQVGVAQTPADTGVNTITYRYATNVVKVDMDLGALTKGAARDKIIQAVGARKAVLSGQRFVQPDFLLMSPVLHDEVTNADMFAASLKRDGSDTTAQGDLDRVKGVPAWGTNQPGINLGDERIIVGQRGLLGYVIAKPYVLGEPFEAVDSNGKAIGKKQAYGEEYSAIKVPTPIRNRMTSVIAYSFTGR